MTPIERISEKAQCLSMLGLTKHANISDVRRAYKRLILEKHPDHGNGTTDEICQITDAYRFLKAHADELGLDMPAPRVRSTSMRSRPELKPTETVFSDEVLEECKAHVADYDTDVPLVATMLHRTGRRLTYFVPNKPKKGENFVVVATGELVDSRSAVPQIVVINSDDVVNGVCTVCSEICEDNFPGARAVQINFGTS